MKNFDFVLTFGREVLHGLNIDLNALYSDESLGLQ